MGLPLLVVFPVIVLGYVYYCYQNGELAEGLICAFFVFSIFRANIPILNPPGSGSLSLYIVDLLGVAVFILLLYDGCNADVRIRDSKLGLAALLGMAFFVLWSFVAAAVGIGPSRLAATVFAIQQSRYLFLCILSAFVIVRTNLHVALYPFSLSIIGNLWYAVGEAVLGHTLGLTYLGDADGAILSDFAVGPLTFTAGLYAGGFVGNGRELIALALLLLPCLVYLTVYSSRYLALGSVVCISAIQFLIRIGETDAGWMASILTMILTGGGFLLSSIMVKKKNVFQGTIWSLYGIGASVVLYAKRFAGDPKQADESIEGTPETEIENGSTTGSSSTNSSGSEAGNEVVSESQELLITVVKQVPGIELNTLGIRLQQYIAAFDLGLLHPLFGIGGYNFSLIATRYGLPSEMEIHNMLLSHLAATGIVGLSAYLVSILSVFMIAVRRTYRTHGEEHHLWMCLMISLIAIHAYGFWVVMQRFTMGNAGLWILSGMIIGSEYITSVESRTYSDSDITNEEPGN